MTLEAVQGQYVYPSDTRRISPDEDVNVQNLREKMYEEKKKTSMGSLLHHKGGISSQAYQVPLFFGREREKEDRGCKMVQYIGIRYAKPNGRATVQEKVNKKKEAGMRSLRLERGHILRKFRDGHE
jgi:hypothetical protein